MWYCQFDVSPVNYSDSDSISLECHNLLAQWLVHWPLVLEVPGSIGAGGEENLLSEHTSLLVICRDYMKAVRRPSTLEVNWSPPLQGQSPDPYLGSILMHVDSSCKHHRSVQCTPHRIIRN